MKKIISIILTIAIFFGLIPVNKVNANNVTNLPFKISGGAIIKNRDGSIAKEIDLEPNFDIDITNSSLYSINRKAEEIEYVVKAEATFDVSSGNASIQPFGIVGDVGGSGVTGYLYMKFTWSSVTEMIQVTQIYGSWDVPSVYYLESKVVDAWTDENHDPFPKYPTSYEFNYTTGWARELWNPPTYISGAKANSSALVTVPGMTGGEQELFLFCEVTYDDLE